MSLQQIITDAYLYFVLRITDKTERMIIIRRFALEELRLSQEEALKFISTVSFESKEDTPSDKFNTFFLWYYIHYMHPNHSHQRFSVEVFAGEIEPFEKTRIYPVLLTTEDHQVTIKPCDPDHAAFWTVNLQLADGRTKSVADCINQDAAQDMETFINEIAKKYQPTV